MLQQILQSTSGKIEIDIYYNNVLTNPSTITIREIRNPNGDVILTNQTPTAGSTTGRYEYTISQTYTSTLGVYSAVWRFTINNITYEHTQYFEVVSSFREGYISPYELRQKTVYEKITDTTPSDDVLQRYINRSTDIINTYLGGSISYAIYSEKRRCILDKINNGIHIQLSHRPIISLTSVQLIIKPNNILDLDVNNFRINEKAGYIEYFSGFPTLKACLFDLTTTNIIPLASVVYTAGYVSIPDEIKTASTIIVEELYKETNGEDKRLARFTIDKITEVYETSKNEEEAIKELGLKNAQAIIKLLKPFRQSYKTLPFAG